MHPNLLPFLPPIFLTPLHRGALKDETGGQRERRDTTPIAEGGILNWKVRAEKSQPSDLYPLLPL